MLFGLFPPQPPMAIREKTWTEVRMRWLARQFGAGRLLKAQVVLPDNQWFPDDYDGTVGDARHLLDRICGFMQIAPSLIRLEVFEDTAMPGAARQYATGLIRLAESQLADPTGLVAVLAHELAHDMLIGRGLLPDELDAEWVTDLLPVYLGLGTASNSSRSKTRSPRAARAALRTLADGFLKSPPNRGGLSICSVRKERKIGPRLGGLIGSLLPCGRISH